MKLQGSYTFPVPPDSLWRLLRNPAVLTAVLPGCQKVELVGENQYQVELITPVGPMAGSYSGSLTLTHVVENEGFTFTFTAQSKTGAMGGNGRFQLQPQAGSTLLTYQGEVKVGGQLHNYAIPLLETNARSFIRQSLENLSHYTLQDQPAAPMRAVAETTAPHPLSGPQHILLISIILGGALALLFYFLNRKTRR